MLDRSNIIYDENAGFDPLFEENKRLRDGTFKNVYVVFFALPDIEYKYYFAYFDPEVEKVLYIKGPTGYLSIEEDGGGVEY